MRKCVEERRYLKTRLEIEVCFGSRNGDRASLGLAPAARLAAPADREAADIVNEETVPRGFAFSFLQFFLFAPNFAQELWVWILFLEDFAFFWNLIVSYSGE